MAITTTTQGIQNGACLSTARPTNPYLGMVIFETDTNKMKVWLGSVWSDGFTHVYTPPTFDYDSIATVTVGAGGQSTITFSSIPQTYKHLQIRGIARTTTTTQDYLVYKPNNANLSARHLLYGNGATASSGGSTTIFDFGQIPKSNDTASVFSVFVMDLLDYNDTSKFKTLRHLGGYDLNGSGQTILASGYYGSATAVTSLVITTYNSTNFAQYSSFALYGIKG